MKSYSLSAVVYAVTCFVAGLPLMASAAESEAVNFNRDVRPILSDKCFTCHGPDENTRVTELRLDQKDSVFAERDTQVVVPGQPEDSELIRRIMSDDDDLRMPPVDSKKQLTAQEKETLRRWVAQGAKWATHWAYVPPVKHAPPRVSDPGRVRNEIDAFILKQLEEEVLGQSPKADEITLVRRLYFDLIGLPPRPEDVDAYVNSDDPHKYEKLVNELLDSKHFGERLAIYWLDVVRYADSNGYHSDEPRKVAPFRDYVIEAFNSNKPYDRFIVEQLAGDLLPEAGIEQQVASGFNMLLQTTNEGGAQEKEYLAKYVADRVRNTSQIFLGSTMGCCECHDHKYDPFTMKDFYSFGAFFADIKERGRGNPPSYPVITEADRKKLDEFDAAIREARAELNRDDPKLDAAQKKWEAETREKLKESAAFTPWHMVGPFKASSFDEVWSKEFGPEAGFDPKKSYGKLKWKKQEKFADGKAHSLNGQNSAWYLHRTATVADDAEVELSLGSDDAIAVWVNGEQIHASKVQRAVEPDQDKVTAKLQAGENDILIKIVNAGGGGGFYFDARKTGVPQNIVRILRLPADKRNDKQKTELWNHFRSVTPQLQDVRNQIARLEKQKDAYFTSLPRTLMTKTRTEPRTIRLLPRGNWMDDSGPVMSPSIPEFLGSLPVEGRPTRLDLARWIASRDNPLTARTLVNRLWKLYFGHGLATPLDDLGRQGTLPTHPELLDWLAVELMDSGWDIKHVIRLLVTSATYRQSSVASPELQKRDPYNQLYARQSRFRLDAEVVRDTALEISGLLVKKIGGRSVYPYQPAGYWRHMNFPKRKWPGDDGSALYRRGLYTWWQRMFLHPSMLAFDAPTREECTVSRPRSNIPQQALVLLNDPTYVEAAREFGRRIMVEGGDSRRERIDWAFRKAVSRRATDREARVLTDAFQDALDRFSDDESAAKAFLNVGKSPIPEMGNPAEAAAWASVARIVLNLHETITRS